MQELRDLFTNKLCSDLGAQLLSLDENKLVIGAMNTNYYKLDEFINELKSNYSLEVTVKGISSEDWERWFDGTDQINGYGSIANAANLPPLVESRSEDNNTSILDTKVKLDASIKKIPVQEADNKPRNRNDVDLLDASNKIYEADMLQMGINIDDVVDVTEEAAVAAGDEDIGNTINSEDFVVKMCSLILMYCYAGGASDIHIEPQMDHLRVRYRVDGKLKTKYSIPKSSANSIVSRMKVLAKLDVAEKRLPQDGRLRIKHNEINIDFRVSTLPGKLGEKVVMRILRSDSSVLKLDKLITFDDELVTVRRLCNSSYGIFIVVGPTGSGKSTTLYSVLAENNDPDVNITTVEDPVEYTLPGIHQVQIIREKGYDFARALRALMRQDPDIILVGETRDKETAQVAMEAALTGHMVFTTLHANDTATAVTRLIEMQIPPYLIGSSLVGLCAQRLVRKVCKKCATLQSGEKNDLLKQFNIQDHLVANVENSSSNKCSECDGTGYKGRVGLYEVLEISDEIRDSILEGANSEQIREKSISLGMKTLTHYGMMLVKNHETTIEEIERVCLFDQTADEIEQEAMEEQQKIKTSSSVDLQTTSIP